GSTIDWRTPMSPIPIGRGRRLRQGSDVALLSLGPIGHTAAKVADTLQSYGISAAHYDLRFAKPLDEDLLAEAIAQCPLIVTLEDGALEGGIGSAVEEYAVEHGYHGQVLRIGVPDEFIPQGSVAELYKLCHMDHDYIVEAVRQRLSP
ncbi:MAG: 1-deoxy-D-xylulose-5-phosphate synthase, partial [Bacteroidales bacterium]|nr:1-deoxy-D-xylulose-5-phosphate synthase [Bacteroidales bacterium]